MITGKRLPGALNNQALNGITDWFGMPTWVRSYWAVVKGKIKELQGLGYQISLHQQKLGVAKSILVARNDPHKNALDDEIRKTQDDLDKWWKVKGYMDTYLPQWMKLDENVAASSVGGVGAVPVVLAGMALVALSYTVTTGMALLQDYAFKSKLTSDVIAQKITSGQMVDIVTATKQDSIAEAVINKVGLGVGMGLPTALLIGGGLYLLYTTGVVGSVMNMLKGSSTQSSGG